MADDDEEPAVELGAGEPVEGAPLARVSARLMWGIEKSTIEKREGETVIRTPEGPRDISAILADVDRTYFATRQEFEDAVRSVIGTGPVPTASSDELPEDDGDDDANDGTEHPVEDGNSQDEDETAGTGEPTG